VLSSPPACLISIPVGKYRLLGEVRGVGRTCAGAGSGSVSGWVMVPVFPIVGSSHSTFLF
jgi:hypothetical protein